MQTLDLLSKITANMMHKHYETRDDFYRQLCVSVFAILIDSFLTKPSANSSSAPLRLDRSRELAYSNNSFGNGTATTNRTAGIAAALVSLIIDFLQMVEVNNTNNRSVNGHNHQMQTKV